MYYRCLSRILTKITFSCVVAYKIGNGRESHPILQLNYLLHGSLYIMCIKLSHIKLEIEIQF